MTGLRHGLWAVALALLGLGVTSPAPALAQATSAASAASASALSAQPWAAQAQQWAEEAARSVLGEQVPLRVEVSAGALDPRMRLAPCAQVQAYIPAGHRPWGRSRLGLRCAQGPVAWKVSVPLTVRVFAPALVAAQPLAAGTVLLAQHLRTEEVDWAERDSPVLASDSAALGRTLAMAVPAGGALRQEQLRKRQWFEAGDPVRLVALGPGFSVSGEGVAMAAGVEGQTVRVRTESGRLVTGTAVGPRRVEIQL